MDSAAAQIGSLTESMTRIAEELQETTSSLREVGMPELLNAAYQTKEDLNNARNDIRSFKKWVFVGIGVLGILQIAQLVLIVQIVAVIRSAIIG